MMREGGEGTRLNSPVWPDGERETAQRAIEAIVSVISKNTRMERSKNLDERDEKTTGRTQNETITRSEYCRFPVHATRHRRA